MMIPHHDGAIAMLFILDTPKSLLAARAAPMETVVEQGFGVLAVHDFEVVWLFWTVPIVNL